MSERDQRLEALRGAVYPGMATMRWAADEIERYEKEGIRMEAIRHIAEAALTDDAAKSLDEIESAHKKLEAMEAAIRSKAEEQLRYVPPKKQGGHQ